MLTHFRAPSGSSYPWQVVRVRTGPVRTIIVAAMLTMLGLSGGSIAGEQCCQAGSTHATSAPSGMMMMTLVKSGSIARLKAYLATPGVSINDRSDNDKALLDFAAEQNQVVIARYLLEHGAPVDAKATNILALGVTALDRTAYFGSVDVAQLLIAHGANVNPTGVGAPPLMFAASGGRVNMLKLLLAHGAELSYQTGAGQTALSEAAAAGHMDIVRWLQARGAAPNARALTDAAARGEVATVGYLLAQNPAPEAVNDALRFAVLIDNGHPEKQQQLVGLLLAHGADANNRANNAPNTPLMLAASAAVVTLLIAHGANVNEATPWGTPVDALACNASIKDPKAIFQLLLVHGANLEAVHPRGRSALDCAAARGHPDFAEFLLDHGMPVDMKDGSGRTPLFAAMDPAMIKLLVAHGANLNAVDGSGLTPLTSALTEQRDSLVLSLLDAGADAKGAPGAAEAPLSIAVRNTATAVARALLERGADPNARNQRGESALEEATEAGSSPIADLLIAHGADLNQRGPMGWTALHYAASRNDGKLVSLLLEHGANPSLVNIDRLPPEALAKSVAVRQLFETRGAIAPTSSTDMRACKEVVQRFRQGTLDQISGGEAPIAPGDPSDDWDYLGQIARPEPVRLQGGSYVLGMGDANAPVYLARVRSDGIESIICEYEADPEAPSDIRLMTMLERLKARSARDFQSVSLESLKVAGLAGARALLEASRRTRDPIPLADDSDANVLGDAITEHRDDLLAFYLEHRVDPNLPWHTHTLIDGVHSVPWHDAPLYTAVRYGSPESVVMLLNHGADPNSAGGGTGMLRETPLSFAVRTGAVATAETLLDHGADPTAASSFYLITSRLQDISRESPQATHPATVISMLLLRGGNPNAWIWVAFQTVARDRSRNDLLTAALGSRLRVVKSEWIKSLLGSEPNVDPGVAALLEEATTIRDSSACPAHASSNALAQCLPNALRSADSALNARYRQLAGRPGPGARRLRSAELAWLKDRDTRCGMHELPSLTEDGWLSYVLAEQPRALCVLNATHQRLSELDRTASAVTM